MSRPDSEPKYPRQPEALPSFSGVLHEGATGNPTTPEAATAPLSHDEKRRIRSQIACTLANLHLFTAFWSPGQRKFMARSVCATRRFRLPADAVPLGLYAAGIESGDVLADLAELLESLPDPAPPACEARSGDAGRARRRPTMPPEDSRAPAGS